MHFVIPATLAEIVTVLTPRERIFQTCQMMICLGVCFEGAEVRMVA